jgi:hypothetical protein
MDSGKSPELSLQIDAAMPDDEIQSLRNDIAKSGYVAEMIATSIFSNAGWQVYDHLYFLDKEENKGREIDLSAVYGHKDTNSRQSVTVKVGLSIEVKTAASKPWVIFTSPLNPPLEVVESLFDTSLIRLHLQEIWFNRLYENHPVTQCERFGRVSYQSFRRRPKDNPKSGTMERRSDDRSVAPNFSAFVSSFKAASEITDFFRQGNNQPLRDEKQLRTYEVGVVHGLVILDGNLYDASVNNDRSFEITKAAHVPYVFNYNSKEYGSRRLLIDVVTLEHLSTYLNNYEKWIVERASYCLKELS